MKVDRIRQIFLEFVRRLPEQGMPSRGANTGPQPLTGQMVIRGNLLMSDELAAGYLEALEKMDEISSAEGTWNKDAIDDLFAKQVLSVATAPMDQRTAAIAQAEREFSEKLNEPSAAWQIDLSVFGANYDLAGETFGKVSFVADNVRSDYAVPSLIQANTDTAFLFARVSVQAINRKAALERAREIVEQHLTILNAICADLIPSRTHLFCMGGPVQRLGLSRSTTSSEDEPIVRIHRESDAVLLSRDYYDAFLERRGGPRASQLLLSSNTFAGRLVSALETAGEACIEVKSHRAFLLHAIALESVVLGRQTQTEITYQLSARVAHLLGADLNARRNIAKTVNDLYSLRSKIVHTGATDVSISELELITQMSLNTLYAFLKLKPFVGMNKIEELEQWFKDRMLGAADDFS
jgi:hypothetical protein